MKIHCIVPVHNRLDSTQRCVNDLLAQDVPYDLVVVVIDDGSSDGTAGFLRRIVTETQSSSRRVKFLTGTGDWWWSRCVNEGIDSFVEALRIGDGVLFMNDDVALDSGYVSRLVETWKDKGPCIVMSQLVDLHDSKDHIASPIKVSPRRLEIQAVETSHTDLVRWTESDVAPGRGTLYPAEVFIAGLRIDQDLLPHYLADYEFSVRASRLGYPIFLAHAAQVRTDRDWGNSKRKGGLLWRMFAPESPELISAYWRFWRVVSPETSAFKLAIRMFRYRIAPALLGRVLTRKMG